MDARALSSEAQGRIRHIDRGGKMAGEEVRAARLIYLKCCLAKAEVDPFPFILPE